MTRQEFIIVVGQHANRKPATVAQYIYSHGFKPAAYAIDPKRPHLRRPDFALNQIQPCVDLVLGVAR